MERGGAKTYWPRDILRKLAQTAKEWYRNLADPEGGGFVLITILLAASF